MTCVQNASLRGGDTLVYIVHGELFVFGPTVISSIQAPTIEPFQAWDLQNTQVGEFVASKLAFMGTCGAILGVLV